MRALALLATLALLPLAGCDTHGIDTDTLGGTQAATPPATGTTPAPPKDPDKPDCDLKPDHPDCKDPG